MSNHESPSLEVVNGWLGPTGSIIFHGMPQSGKNSQAKALADSVGAELFASGDILRANRTKMANGDEEVMDTGGLVGVDTFKKLILDRLPSPEYADKRLILSGTGRFGRAEAHKTREALMLAGHALQAVVYLEATEEEVRRRHEIAIREDHNGDQRKDDQPGAFENRLVVFERETLPAIGYFRDLGLLVPINANGSKEEVSELVIDKLAHFSKNR